jgi:CheY-like chemotaxis protein
LARKILLADDSVTAQNMGRKILADAGYEVITVNNGSAALKKIAEHKPDLIVLDVYMPGYSGLEVCQRLKEAQETSRVPVLLTVGKLEPFKPEEAKRARADAFIVKPFEASELLSALSKLEDKIVPRPESSKPGRFARANAALDEAKYDKTVAVDEDSSWKNRIVFPKKKDKAQVAREEKVAQEEADDSAYYNPMNKDLRTVIERRPMDEPHKARQQARAEEDRVDLGALAPEGLPKDVTPEEIAALAAAAAQVKGKIAEAKDETKSDETSFDKTRFVETKFAESKFAESKFAEAQVAQAKFADAEIAEEKPEPKAAELPQEVAAPAPPVATFAEQKSEEKIDPKIAAEIESKVEAKIEAEKIEAEKIEAGKSSEAGSLTSPTSDDLMAAITALEPDPVASTGAGSGNGSWLHDAPNSNVDEPVTMALAAAVAAGSSGVASRWTAVAVALAPEESGISLELEMQKACAALAAAEAVRPPVVAPIQESQPPAVYSPAAQSQETQPVSALSAPAIEASSPLEAAPAEATAPEPVVPVPAIPTASSVSEATPALNTVSEAPVTNDAVKIDAAANDGPTGAVVSNAAAEAITEAVKELEAKAAAYAEQIRPPASLSEPAPVDNFKVAFPLDAPTFAAASTEAAPALDSSHPALDVADVESAKPEEPQRANQELSQPENLAAKLEEKFTEKSEQKHEQKHEEAQSEAPAPVVSPIAAKEETPATHAAAPETAPAFINEVPAEPASAQQVSSDTISSLEVSSEAIAKEKISTHIAAALDELAAGGMFDMAKKESEIAATTAAAWASWRRIRETGDKTADSAQKEESAAPQDEAAMAVAAGAEKAPEGAHTSESESDDIAGIVDSVLADLRPKIVEEISRKMGKKK